MSADLFHRLEEVRYFRRRQRSVVYPDFVYGAGEKMFVRPAGARIRRTFLIVRGSDSESDFGIRLPEAGRKSRNGGPRSVEIELEGAGPFYARHVVPRIVVTERIGTCRYRSFRSVVIEIGHAPVGVLND